MQKKAKRSDEAVTQLVAFSKSIGQAMWLIGNPNAETGAEELQSFLCVTGPLLERMAEKAQAAR